MPEKRSKVYMDTYSQWRDLGLPGRDAEHYAARAEARSVAQHDVQTHSTFERVMAWGSMLGLIAATVAAMWTGLGVIAGLATFSLFAGVTGYMAATDRLVQK